MDRFFDSFSAKSSSQKTLIIIGGTIAFLLFLVFSYFLTTPSQNNATQTSGNNPQPSIKPVSPKSVSKPQNMQMESNSFYSINYPDNWQEQIMSVNGGGSLISFMPVNAASSEAFPRIDIQVASIAASGSSMMDKIKYLSVLNLKQSNTIFHSQSAIQLSGLLPFNSNIGNKPIYKTFLFIEKSGVLYVVDYAYLNDNTAQSSINSINNSLATFKFTEGQ